MSAEACVVWCWTVVDGTDVALSWAGRCVRLWCGVKWSGVERLWKVKSRYSLGPVLSYNLPVTALARRG